MNKWIISLGWVQISIQKYRGRLAKKVTHQYLKSYLYKFSLYFLFQGTSSYHHQVLFSFSLESNCSFLEINSYLYLLNDGDFYLNDRSDHSANFYVKLKFSYKNKVVLANKKYTNIVWHIFVVSIDCKIANYSYLRLIKLRITINKY